jgi:hypothetical protein
LNEFYSFCHQYNFSISQSNIYPNHYGTFCYLSQLSQLDNIPQKLIDIKQVLSKDSTDIKLRVIHPEVHGLNVSRITLEEMCQQIDNLIISIYNSSSYGNYSNFKVHTEYIIKNWIENDEKRGKILFPCCINRKTEILFNIIWDNKMKQLMGDFNKIPLE